MIINGKVAGEIFLNRLMTLFADMVLTPSSFYVPSVGDSLSEILPRATSSRRCHNVSDSNQIVRRHRKREHPPASVKPFVASLPQQPDRLDPTEDLFNPFSLPLTDRITRMTGGPLIDRTTSVGGVLRHRRGDVQLLQRGHKLFGVKQLIGTNGNARPVFFPFPRMDFLLKHLFGRFSFRFSRGLSVARPNCQTVAVIHQDVSHERELCFLARSLFIEKGLRVCCRLMRVVLALFTVEVYGRDYPGRYRGSTRNSEHAFPYP